MASTYAGAAASFMNAVSASMKIVQHYTKHWPSENGIGEIKFDGYPDLEKMMSVDGGPSFEAFAAAPVMRTSVSEAPIAAAAGIPATIAPTIPLVAKLVDGKVKKAKKPKDPNAPKRPVTAYFVYLEERREPIAKELGPNSKPGDVQAKATEEWNALSDELKESYRARYRVKLEQYHKEMDAYKKKKAEMGEPVDDDADGASTLVTTTIIAPDGEEAKIISPAAKKRGPAKGKGKAAIKADDDADKTPAGKKTAATPDAKKRKSDAADRSTAKKRKSEAAEAEAEPKKKGGRKKKADA